MSERPGCIAQGCTRLSRAKRKATYCNTCYTRKRTGSPPKFPSDPLLEYMAAVGVNWPRRGGERPAAGSKITLERLDAICVDTLGIHPYQVYGDLYFQECVS